VSVDIAQVFFYFFLFSFHFISFHFISFHFISFHFFSFHAFSHFISSLRVVDELNRSLSGNKEIHVRIGINSGSVVAGVIGQTKVMYVNHLKSTTINYNQLKTTKNNQKQLILQSLSFSPFSKGMTFGVLQ